MPSASSIEDFTQRTFESWKVWQQGKDNGVVLFVFIDEHRMRIHTGYGLEGALPDATCDQIIRNEIAPHLRSGDYEGGLQAGINSVIAATKGEYHGSGSTVYQRKANSNSPIPLFIFFIIFLIVLVRIIHVQKRGGYGYSGFGGPFIGGMGGSGGSWGSGGDGGGFSGFTGGGFSGGSGGGGASGNW
jgi:uncharacterized protein